MRRFLLLVMVALWVALCGCATGREGWPVRSAEIRTIRGVAVIRYGDGLFGGSREAVLAAAPGLGFRADILSPLGSPEVQITVERESLTIFWPGTNRYFKGEATRGNFEAYFSVPIDPKILADLAVGRTPYDSDVLQVRYAARKIRVRFPAEGKRLEIRFHEMEINPPMKRSYFRLKIPHDATMVGR